MLPRMAKDEIQTTESGAVAGQGVPAQSPAEEKVACRWLRCLRQVRLDEAI